MTVLVTFAFHSSGLKKKPWSKSFKIPREGENNKQWFKQNAVRQIVIKHYTIDSLNQ